MESKKRIGIFTYMLSNYGAVLQCYALQRYLRNNTSNIVEVIDFTTNEHLKSLRLFRRKSDNPLKNILMNLLTFVHYSDLNRRKKRTTDFKRENINYSPRYSDMETLLSNPPTEDVYVTGSDQVFNLNSKYVDVYYLNFEKGDSRKVAYAPSLGVADFGRDYQRRVPQYISDFDALSCREQSGAEFLSKITGNTVPVVADPTMLLSKEEWLKVAKAPGIHNYILIYDLNGRESLVSIAKHIQKKINCKIVCITDNLRQNYNVDKIVCDAGPSEFLGWFANASYIVTDSFHGTSFSLIFNKPFSTYIASPKTADRLYTILKQLNQNERIIDNGGVDYFQFRNELLQQPDANISEYILSSKQYIGQNILNI